MNSLYKDLQEGLEQAIEFEKGKGKAKIHKYIIKPVEKYDNKQIRAIRNKAGMTQSVFACYMGVSIKTVEAWERGRIHPTGPAYRLLSILNSGKEEDFAVIEKA